MDGEFHKREVLPNILNFFYLARRFDRIFELPDDQRAKGCGTVDAIHLGVDEFADVLADLKKVGGEEGVRGFLVDDGEGLPGGLLGVERGEVEGDTAAERFKLDGLAGGVGDDAAEFARGEGGYAGFGDDGFELLGVGDLDIGGGGGEGLSVLEGAAEAVGEEAGRFAGGLATDDVTAGIENDVGDAMFYKVKEDGRVINR